MSQKSSAWRNRSGWFTCLVLLASFARAAGAAEPPAASLGMVPQDSAFYTATLRIGEQIDIVKNSNWWQRANEWELVQQAKMLIQFGLMQGPGQQAMIMWQMPENQQLVELLQEMIAQEAFCYGDAQTTDVIALALEVANSLRYGSMFYQLVGDDGPLSEEEFIFKMVLDSMAEDVANVAIPTMVLGFKINNNEAAQQQLSRLEAAIKALLPQLPDELDTLKDGFQREQIGDSEFLTMTLDGSLVPWQEIEFERMEDEPGQYDALQKKLQEMTLVISLGVHKGFLLLSLGPSNDHLAQLGQGKVLADHPKLAPLRSLATNRITGIGYASEELMQAAMTKPEDIDEMVDWVKQLLPLADLDEEEQQQIQADVAELAKDLKPYLPTAGARLGFSFLTDRGYEAYRYNWVTNSQLDGSQPLPLLNHLGGSPLFAILARTEYRPQDYDLLVKWLKKGRGYFEEYVVPQMSEADLEGYQQFAEIAFPILSRLDAINRQKLIPSMADGQAGLSIDAETKTTQWTTQLPATTEPIGLPSPALVIGLKDPELFKQALGEYRLVINDLIKAVHRLNPEDVPDVQIPPARQRNLDNGAEVFYYPLPEDLGVYEGVAPNIAVTDAFAAISMLPRHTKKIVQPQPLEVDGGPLKATDRPLAVVVYFRWVNLVDMVVPWVNEGVRMYVSSMAEGLGALHQEEGLNANGDVDMAKPLLENVRKGAELLKVFRGYTSATYLEEGALVTHSESRFEDVD
ncbi:MAG: hypothetical protein GTO53_11940 [Planctomycetales bacterium]|nr:hypothetical protein [Planctomycetales bacterium]NIM09820.1 hypothetical protein [Planctomycetales bacterium]NIN09289.1 hypothetical protein [Planctomycetales bacterium]NIN78392.1 hypothetical protein [Planctomycetales bacterium]NIO35570.1 hypothetical protein [Planctomycetales bacterium]